MPKLHNDIERLLSDERIRRHRRNDQWLYSVVDLIRVVGQQPNAAEYWEDLKRWEPQLADLCQKIKLPAADGLWAEVEMTTTEQAFRLLQSLSSPTAEQVKLWLAEAGRQRLEEQADPELAVQRTRKLYDERGYSRDWIAKRLQGIGARHELTREWYRRGLRQGEEFRGLTNRFMDDAFGMDVAAYKRYKGLRSENLRDHMSELELALTVLGETTASLLHKQRNSHGFEQLRQDVQDVGQITAQTRMQIEQRLGRSVTSEENYLRPLFSRKRVSV